MLKGRLGLATARIPQSDRFGLLWLSRGRLWAEDGTLRFTTAGDGDLPAGDYAIPFQMLSGIMLQPGTTVTHDVLRLLSGHGTALVVIGCDAVRYYASMPYGPHDSKLARTQAMMWSHPDKRIYIARKMYAWRMGEIFPNSDLNTLRGMEGARMKEMYKFHAQKHQITWNGRKYDRENPDDSDLPNQAINHAATAVKAAAFIATAVTGAIPQLGFIHEDSGNSFCLDIADLFRDLITIPLAFSAVKELENGNNQTPDRCVRYLAGQMFRKKSLVGLMIEKIKGLFDDCRCDI